MGTAARLALLIGAVCVLAQSGHAASCTSTEACLQHVETAQRATQSLRARFTQTKHMSLLNEPLVATGKFAFKRPDRILWDIEQPDKATVIITGDRLIVPGLPEKDREALNALPMATALSQIGALFTGDVKALRTAFDCTARGTATGIEVALVPQQPKAQGMFSRIDVTFAAPDLRLRKIQLQNRLGDRVEVVLDDVEVNVPVPDDLFTGAASAPGTQGK